MGTMSHAKYSAASQYARSDDMAELVGLCRVRHEDRRLWHPNERCSSA